VPGVPAFVLKTMLRKFEYLEVYDEYHRG
jgi:hypothetical protein